MLLICVLLTNEPEGSMNQLLQLSVSDGSSVDATMQLRWALRPALAAELKRKKARNAAIVFETSRVVDVDDKYTAGPARQIVPLDQLQAYISFQRPGRHEVKIYVTWNNDGVISSKNRKKLFERKSDGDFRYWISQVFDDEIACETIDVDVTDKFFAKEPPKWLWEFGNFVYNQPPRDQCHFRRRLLLSPLANPIVLAFVLGMVGLKIATMLIVAWALAIAGTRNVNYNALLHPLDHDVEDLYRNKGASVFFYDDHGKKRKGILPFLYPPAILALLVLITGLATFTHYSWIEAAEGVSAVVAMIITAFAFMNYVDKRADEREAAAENNQIPEPLPNYMDLTYSPKKDNGQMPVGRRTIALAFQELKVKLCRPYAVG